jgi:hypothetical protein
MSWLAQLGAELGSLRGRTGREAQLRLDTARLFILISPSYASSIPPDASSITLDDMPSFKEQAASVANHVGQAACSLVLSVGSAADGSGASRFQMTAADGSCYKEPAAVPAAFSARRMRTRGSGVRNIADKRDFRLRVAPSSIPGAGLGVFVDGTADAGSLITIYPGRMYRPCDVRFMPDFPDVSKNNEYLMWRYDGIIVDGNSPSVASLLAAQQDDTDINSYACGQFVNHPPRGGGANALQYVLDINLDTLPPRFHRLVPNEPWQERTLVDPRMMHDEIDVHGDSAVTSRRPAWTLGFMDRAMRSLEDAVIRQRVASSALLGLGRQQARRAVRNSLAIVATRPIADEEVFINYRFNPESPALPDWYEDCDSEESRRRWSQEGFWQ